MRKLLHFVNAFTLLLALAACTPRTNVAPTETAKEREELALKHVLREGETLEDVARYFGITLAELLSYNPGLKENAAPGTLITYPWPENARFYERGIASWYGPRFHGRRTASGETFDQYQLTAAHPRLPFGTRVLVRREDTGETVVVRINDRGPFKKGRIIDLSYAAARAIGLIEVGLAEVSLYVLP